MVEKRALIIKANDSPLNFTGNALRRKRIPFDSVSIEQAQVLSAEDTNDKIIILHDNGKQYDMWKLLLTLREKDITAPVILLSENSKESWPDGFQSIMKPPRTGSAWDRFFDTYRQLQKPPEDSVQTGKLAFNLTTGKATLAGFELILAPRESAILKILFEAGGAWVKPEDFVGYTPQACNHHIRNIWGKIKDAIGEEQANQYIPGMSSKAERENSMTTGYRLNQMPPVEVGGRSWVSTTSAHKTNKQAGR